MEINVNLIEYSRLMVREIDGQIIADLKESIKQYGVLQPIVIFRNENDKWEVICGNHRLCAARGIRLKTIPVVMRQCSSSKALLLGLTENIQRFEMNPVREGEIYHNMLVNSAYTSEGIASKINKSKEYVEGRLRIFRNLHPKLKSELGKTLNITNATALSKLSQDEQLIVFSKIKAVSDVHLNRKPLYPGVEVGRGFEGLYTSPYCVCEKCGSKHVKGVSVGDDKRAEKILSKMQQ